MGKGDAPWRGSLAWRECPAVLQPRALTAPSSAALGSPLQPDRAAPSHSHLLLGCAVGSRELLERGSASERQLYPGADPQHHTAGLGA